MSNPNIKDFAKLGAAKRWSNKSEEERKEIMKIVRSSRGKHICQMTCKCKWCGTMKARHSVKCIDKIHSFECLLATSSISTQVGNIRSKALSLRDFNRSQKKYLSQITTDKPLIIVSLETSYKISKV